jgi:hypothetical protein
MNLPTARRVSSGDHAYALSLASSMGAQNAERIAGLPRGSLGPVSVRRDDYSPPPAPAPEVVEEPVIFFKTRLERIHDFIRATVEPHGFTLDEVFGPSRTEKLAWARFEAMAKVQDEFGLSLPRIGKIFGGRDHSTVHNAVTRYRENQGEKRSGRIKVALDRKDALRGHLALCDIAARGNDAGAAAWRDAAAAIRWLASKAEVTL